MTYCIKVLPGSSDSEESACNAGDLASILGVGRSPGEGKDYPLPSSGPENPTQRRLAVYKVAVGSYKGSTRAAESQTRLSN